MSEPHGIALYDIDGGDDDELSFKYAPFVLKPDSSADAADLMPWFS
jgi:hypothetical protein